MYKSIDDFLISNSLKGLVMYDFTNEDPCNDVRNETDPIKKFQKFKASDSIFDPDSSNGSCPLTNSIYEKLWGWNYNNRFSMPEYLSKKLATKWERMGADTMNSFQTTYTNALKIYSGNYNSVNSNGYLGRFASLTHSVGNFTLVPFKLDPVNDVKSFNQYRGYNSGKYFVCDYFDLSLKIIKENVNDSMFKSYIDTFFLNDYVDNQYNVKPLFKAHKKFLNESKLSLENPEKFHPQNEAELNEYLENVLQNIMLRGNRIMNVLKKYNPPVANEKSTNNCPVGHKNIKPSKSMMDIRKLVLTLIKIIIAVGLLLYFLDSSYYIRINNSIWIAIIAIVCSYLFFKLKKKWKQYWCTDCKKYGLYLLKRTCNDTKKISIKKILETKNASGGLISTSEQYIPGTRKYYTDVYKCKYCGHEKTENVSQDFDNA